MYENKKKYEMRTQTSVDHTENDLRYEIKFENCVKDKKNFSIKRKIAFFLEKRYSWRHIFLRFLRI